MNDEKIKRLITLYELIIHGDQKRFGLLIAMTLIMVDAGMTYWLK